MNNESPTYGYYFFFITKEEGRFLYSKKTYITNNDDEELITKVKEHFDSNNGDNTFIIKDGKYIIIAFRNKDFIAGFANGLWFSEKKEEIWNMEEEK